MTQSSLSLHSMATKTEKFLLNNPFWFLLFLVGLVAFLLLANIAIFPSLTLRGDIALDKIFIGTIAIVAVVERSVELFIAAWRNPEKEVLEQEISPLKNLASPSDEEKAQLISKEKELLQYITLTKKYALLLSLVFGFMASFTGIRILEPLVNMTTTKPEQIATFYKLDLVLSALGIGSISPL
jgi:glucan phosphoethanolaminetransferase (alkaline phosphatase superfamily)